MIFKTKNTLLPPSWFEKQIIDTLKLYDEQESTKDSPLAEFMRHWDTTGGMHLDCYEGYKNDGYEKAIQERLLKVFSLYDTIKRDGYKDEKPILVSFDHDGYMTLYDGHHRTAILKHLGIEVEVTVSTEWKGAVDGTSGKDFPLFETVERLHKGKRILYQWVPEERLRDLPCSRTEAHAEERLNYLLRHLKGKTVLDIGCSEGYFSVELAKRGYEVVSVDISRDLVSIARYLTAIQGVGIQYRVGKWQDIVRGSKYFDNVIYFSVLHNQINAEGQQKAFEDLELFRGKVGQLFVEFPDIQVQPDWAYVFKQELFDKALQNRTKLNIQDRWQNSYRPVYLLNQGVGNLVTELPRNESFTTYHVNGIGTMYFPDNDYVSASIFNTGVWEPKTTEFIKKHLKRGKVFVDVGSQMGYYTLLAAKQGAKVHAFEPSSRNREYLERNIGLNGVKNITVYKVALYNNMGQMKLYSGGTSGQTSLISSRATKMDYELVDTISYDTLDIGVPDMVKIDVEGCEKQVLEGMQSFLTTDKPVYLIIEDWYNKVTDWLVDTYGFKLITTERAYGNRILAKNIKVKYVEEPIRIHLLGPFNTPTTLADEGVGNAFASKTVRMAKILKRLGHYVIFYGVEGSDVECDEFVQVSTKDVLEKTYGKWEKDKVYGCQYGDLAHRTFNENAVKEILQRRLFGDFLLCCFGTYQKQIADAVKIPDTVEIGIGYTGSFAKYRIFESYYMMNATYGATKIGDIQWGNTVIPGFFEEQDFEYSDEKDDYFLYLGRVVKRKGILIAKQVCEKLGKKLVVAGFISRDNKADIAAANDVLNSPNVEYVGFAGVEKRKKLMSRAKAVFMPTTYLEPFGYVAIEAMFSGTPVITTDAGAFPETILHGTTGYRCNNFEEFCWAAGHIDNIKPRDCRLWAETNYSMDRATKMYKEYFTRILNAYGKGWYADNNQRTSLDCLKITV